jgi:quercetin dioxygenase-like cupin family protein
MNSMNRRDVFVALSSFAALAAVSGTGEAQSGVNDGVLKSPQAAGETVLSTQRVFRFADLPVSKGANGESRAVTHGVLPTGESVELHETSLLPGHMPHPAHKHRHSEFMLIREGDIEFDNNGTPERVGPGGVIFAASNVMHGLKNVGTTTAQYFVLAIGRETPAEKV